MSYGCFEVECSESEMTEKKKKNQMSLWNPLTMTSSVCCFIQHLLENHNSEMPLSFSLIDLPLSKSFNPDNLSGLRNLAALPIPTIDTTDLKELFSVYGVTFLQNMTGKSHTFLHNTCCYCGSYLCTKNHYDFKFIEVIQRKDVWHYFSSSLMISDPFESKLHFTNETQSLIFMVDFIYHSCLVYNKNKKKVENCFTFPSKVKKQLQTIHQPKNPLPLSTHCFQSLWWKNIDWTKLPKIIPHKMLKKYPLYKFFDVMESFASEMPCYLQENRIHGKNNN